MIDQIEEPLQQWADENDPSQDPFLYYRRYWEQIGFIRKAVPGTFGRSQQEWQEIRERIQVISTHRSKSVTLPVYKVELPDGIVLILRGNFRNWKVSVETAAEIEVDCMGLFSPHEQVNANRCEGLPKSLIYGPYVKNKRRFTCEIGTDLHLFIFLWRIAHRKRAS